MMKIVWGIIGIILGLGILIQGFFENDILAIKLAWGCIGLVVMSNGVRFMKYKESDGE